MDFDRRCKDIEARFTEKLGDMRKQLENRWKQIDKFEISLKSYADTKVAWKRKLSQKEGELEAIKVSYLFLFLLILLSPLYCFNRLTEPPPNSFINRQPTLN
jgi:hypothetical protein